MKQFSVYVDRLDYDKLLELRKLYGGEYGWTPQWLGRMSQAERLQFGKDVIDLPCKDVYITSEKNATYGYSIPIVVVSY